MSETGVIRGFKVFDPDWTCRDKQYTCPGHLKKMLSLLFVVEGYTSASERLTASIITVSTRKTRLQK